MPMTKNGRCMKDAAVYGVVTMSDKGQIAIPVQIRNELDLKSGDKLMIIKRRDCAGFVFINLKAMDGLMEKIATDDKFFDKIG